MGVGRRGLEPSTRPRSRRIPTLEPALVDVPT